MVINSKYKLVFLHIPKTGGSSIVSVIKTMEHSFKVGRTRHHVVPTAIPDDYFVFSIVRNPWDRILSYYLFRHAEPRTRKRKGIHPDERKINFSEWLHRIDEFAAWPEINPAFEIAVAPQSEVIGDLAEFIGRYENLESDFDHICERIGFPKTSLVNRNPTTPKTRPYADYYDNDTKQLVASRYVSDVDAYGYQF
jgi:chondroitin 4-sulfotransferase 11